MSDDVTRAIGELWAELNRCETAEQVAALPPVGEALQTKLQAMRLRRREFPSTGNVCYIAPMGAPKVRQRPGMWKQSDRVTDARRTFNERRSLVASHPRTRSLAKAALMPYSRD
jgi:hypothetical protein